MPALFIFLFKVNIALVLFCLGYYLVLRHLTFYTLNRIYLVIAILFSTLYPNINLSDFVQHHRQLAQPVQTVILNWKAPAENFVKPLYPPYYWQWVELIFWAGVVLFAARLIMQLFSLYKLYRHSKPGQVHNYPVRLIRNDISPFSFWRSIYINPANLSPADLKSALEHEQIHVNEWHTVDILLAELSTIFYWFNPGVWLMKKAVRENVEFITDQKILQKGMDSKQYQYSLVNVCLATSSNTIVNHFNISTIKKRIIMMNAKRSSGYNLTRYVFLVPAVVALLLVFSLSKAAISKKGLPTFKSIATAVSNISIINNKPNVSLEKETAIKSLPGKAIVKNVDTIYTGNAKSKKGGKNFNKSFLITSNSNSDSINYVINGVKGTKAEVKAINPARIESFELLSAEKAKEFFPELTNDKQVLFVTTEDSETGKKLKEKIDKTIGGGKLAGSGHTISTEEGESSGSGISTNVDENVNTVVIAGEPKIETKTVITKKNMTFAYAPKSTVIVKNIDADSTYEVKVNTIKINPDIKLEPMVMNLKTVKLKPMVFKVGTNDESTIDNFSNTLIIIDGKESKGLKNISQSDIKSISMLKDEAAERRYGKKGRNGVIIITTKKGSK
jgi:TonB-dependent SusC/RagA subfamily outer membrane receptor